MKKTLKLMKKLYPQIPRGRPKKYDLTKEEYNIMYYRNNKEKSKGNCICEICQLMISKSNKSRHHKSKIHLKNLEKIIGKCQVIVDSYDPELIIKELYS